MIKTSLIKKKIADELSKTTVYSLNTLNRSQIEAKFSMSQEQAN